MKTFRNLVIVLGIVALGVALLLRAPSSVVSAKLSDPQAAVLAPILTEDFAYSTGDLITVGTGWAQTGTTTTNPIQVTSPSLTYTNFPGSGTGNAVSMTTSGQDVNKLFSAPVTTGTVYAAFLVNASAAQLNGDYFFHYYVDTSTFFGRVFIKKDAASEKFSFGISRTATSASTTLPVYTAANYDLNHTYLLVVKYTFNSGTTTDDTASLFVDPVPGSSEPAATITAVDALPGINDPAGLPGIGIRQGTAANASTQRIDSIRVAATWEEAVATSAPPPTPTPTPTPTATPTATPTPAPQKANADYNGDGKTDFAIVREPGFAFKSSPFAAVGTDPKERRKQRRSALKRQTADAAAVLAPGDYQWSVSFNGAQDGLSTEWGIAQHDDIVSGDFDGDKKDDIAIWRPGVPGEAGYWWINSTDSTFHFVPFGFDGDDSSVLGDYDGDGKDDPAIFRCPASGGQCTFYYQGSLNNPGEVITAVPWGYGTIDQWAPNPGDFDGDGKFDFCLQDLRGTHSAPQWLTLNGPGTAVQYEVIDWGLVDDFVIPGDFDGDGRSDFCLLRYVGNDLIYWILERDGGIRTEQWGIDGDIPVPGDYDGDGSQDIAVSRGNATDSTFWVLPSNGSPYWTFNYGLPTDTPVANWYVQ